MKFLLNEYLKNCNIGIFFFLGFFVYNQTIVHNHKKIKHQDLVWFSYFIKKQITKKLEIESDVQERFFFKPLAQHQFVVRSMLTAVLANELMGSAGLCYFLQSPQEPKVAKYNLVVPEIRPHIEFKNKQKLLQNILLKSRIRIEARFHHQTNELRSELKGGYTFSNFRFRYQLSLQIPLLSSLQNNNLLSLILMDEVMFNAGHRIIYNMFDQNRIYIALGTQISQNHLFELGYMNWFQQESTGYSFINRNILRFTLTHKINFTPNTLNPNP